MRNLQRAGLALALAVLVLAPAAVAAAQETESQPESQMEEQATLTGQLSQKEDGSYVLIEAEGGEEVLLRGSEEQLAEHVGAAVKLTGSWEKDDQGRDCFKVASVERLPAAP
jgi:hypothetical protein